MKKLSKNKWKIPLYKVNNDVREIEAISKVIKRGMDWAIGSEIEHFEQNLAKYIGTKYCVAFNSGTSAGHAALLSYNLGKNDEIIVPSFSFIATANWPLMVNSIPKFVDIENTTFGMDPNKIEESITKKTKAIIPVHYAGLPCKINEIKKIAKKHNLLLIEDAAESIGAHINKKKVGTFGDMGIFSFAGNKILTSGEGGAVVTNSKKQYEKLKLIRSHGRKTTGNYFSNVNAPTYLELGFNWRMSSITAALALSQLNKIEKLIQSRRKHVSQYHKNLKKLNGIKFHSEPKDFMHVYQLFNIQLPSKKIRNNLMEFLAKKGIMSKVFFEPIHSSYHFKKYRLKHKNLIVTKQVSDTILSLPMYPDLTKNEINKITDSIIQFMKKV